jgi:hypothetical protein
LSAEEGRQEQEMLEHVLNSPSELARHQRQSNEDEDRIGPDIGWFRPP